MLSRINKINHNHNLLLIIRCAVMSILLNTPVFGQANTMLENKIANMHSLSPRDLIQYGVLRKMLLHEQVLLRSNSTDGIFEEWFDALYIPLIRKVSSRKNLQDIPILFDVWRESSVPDLIDSLVQFGKPVALFSLRELGRRPYEGEVRDRSKKVAFIKVLGQYLHYERKIVTPDHPLSKLQTDILDELESILQKPSTLGMRFSALMELEKIEHPIAIAIIKTAAQSNDYYVNKTGIGATTMKFDLYPVREMAKEILKKKGVAP